jgi:hypothetical protein
MQKIMTKTFFKQKKHPKTTIPSIVHRKIKIGEFLHKTAERVNPLHCKMTLLYV